MSAREEILRHPGVLATADAEIGALLDKHRAEVLREEATRLRRVEREMPHGAHGARMGVLKAALVLDEDADLLGDKASAPAATSPACAACHQPFDPTGWRHTDRGRHRVTPFCRSCVDRCHDSEDAFHRCPVCRAAEEKTTAAAAAVTPQPTAGWHAARALASRLDRLLDLIRAEGGEWRTGRVHRIYRAVEDAPQRVTARRDLEALHALGWLERHTAPGDCFYTLNTRKDGHS